MRLLGMMLMAITFPVLAQVEIERPWARATAPGAKIAAGYMVIHNKSAAPDRLVGGATPAAARVETHVQINDGEIMRMREVKGYDVTAKASFELKPGGAHLMFVDISQPFKEGDTLPVILKFEKAGEVKAEFHVGRLAAPPAHHKH